MGKGASRRLRRLEGMIPSIVYGANKKPTNITLEHKELMKHLEHEAFYSHIISLEIDGKAEDVILKDLQRHPAKEIVLHADFLRVSKTKKLHMQVPLHFINEDICVGAKMDGGMISHAATQLEVSCLPANLPEFIEVDLAELKIGENIHISDMTLPKGVESVALSHGADHDLLIAAVNKPKGAAIEEDGDSEGEEAEAGEE
jgi:large subunit ribosomal protein L25